MNSPRHDIRSTGGYLSNFRDPFGLMRRMLRSRNSAARSAILRETLRPCSFPLDMLMSLRERRLMRREYQLNQPVLLIAGAPRSGTTLLYQLLASGLKTGWFPNVSEMFPRAPITASQLFSSRKHSGRSQNFYGQTTGLSAPNDGFHIWNRWFGEDRYQPTLLPNNAESIHHFFAAWTTVFPRPLINKNNRNTVALAQLGEILPKASFVILRRDAGDVARSLVRAREFVQGDRKRAWGLLSQETVGSEKPMQHIDDVCDQIANIDCRLADGLNSLDPSRVVEMHFEDVCDDPVAAIRAISALSQIPLRENHEQVADSVRTPTRRLLSDAEEHRLAERLLRTQHVPQQIT